MMKQMNSSTVGLAFEKKILKLLKREIVQGTFFGDVSRTKIFARKGYFSRDRKKEIVFDISLEISLPGQSTYSILVLIECKNYSHAVPVDDVEEFYSKVQQVSGLNVKAIVASSNSFQEGAFSYAESKGIGLLRYYHARKFKWELTRSPSALVSFSFAETAWQNAQAGLRKESHQSAYFDGYFFYDGHYTNSLRSFMLGFLFAGLAGDTKTELSRITTGVEDTRNIVRFIEDDEIEKISISVLQAVKYEGGKAPLVEICQWQTELKNLKLVFEKVDDSGDSQQTILGSIRFRPLSITIYQSAEHTKERERFTLAHELGHLLLGHSKYLGHEFLEESDLELENPAELGLSDLKRLEWQANYFASCLLLPTYHFAHDLFSILDARGLRDRGFGALFLDNQPCNVQSFRIVTSMLQTRYGVSRQVVRLRLKKLGLLTEA